MATTFAPGRRRRAFRLTEPRRRAAGLDADHNQPKKELPDTLALDGVPQLHVGRASRKVQDQVRSPVEQTGRDDNQAVGRRGALSLSDVGLCVWRQPTPGELR